MIMSVGAIAVLGLIMSIDGVVPTVVLTIEYGKTFFTPVVISIGHLLFLFMGSAIAKSIKTSHRVHNILLLSIRQLTYFSSGTTARVLPNGAKTFKTVSI